MIRSRSQAWEQFIQFLKWDIEIHKIIATTNAIESLNARYQRSINARGVIPLTTRQR